jgi:hypothetical protein
MASATEVKDPNEIFAVDLAALAREIAMDIFEVEQILELHKLSSEEWAKIQENPRFKAMLEQMVVDWAAASNTRERVRIKAATGLESKLEEYIHDISDPEIPLSQRVEAGKFLARLGELDGQLAGLSGSGGGNGVVININTGAGREGLVIDARSSPSSLPVLPDDEELSA